jgi:hypothetical protein
LQRLTIPTTGLTVGQTVRAELRYPAPLADHERDGTVTMLYEGGTVLVDFGRGIGTRVFRADGSERTLNRWGARLVGVVE